jgi:hypothetical protein
MGATIHVHGGVSDGRGGATRWSRGDDEILKVLLFLARIGVELPIQRL